MSYLIGPRIVFCGRFLSDVPTANNVRAAFERFPQGPDPGWNPAGSGCFDFLDCHVRGGERAPGEPVGEGAPELGLAVLGAADRSSAKLVDLDPDWQNSSEIWGLSVRIVDPATAEELLSGSFRAAAFRDVWRRQLRGVEVNGMPVTASFTSVLDDVVFGPGCAAYPVLDALRQTITVPRLSIVLNVFGFFYNHVEDCFATGSLTGCIGPWHAGEPLTFVTGRRLDGGQLPGPSPTVPLGRSVAAVDPAASRLVIDLGNAYPIEDHTGTPVPLPPTVTALEVGVLQSEAVSAGASLPADGARIVGEVPVEQTRRQAGIFSFPSRRPMPPPLGNARSPCSRDCRTVAASLSAGRRATASTCERTGSSTAWTPEPLRPRRCIRCAGANPPSASPSTSRRERARDRCLPCPARW